MRTTGKLHQLGWTNACLAILGAACDDSKANHLIADSGIDAAYTQDSGGSGDFDASAAPLRDATVHLDARAPEAGALDSVDAGQGFLTCPSQQLQACATRSGVEWEVLLDASEFGIGARFVAMGGEAVLVQEGDSSWRLIRLQGDFSEAGPLLRTTWSFPPGDGLAIDVTTASGARFNGVFAVVCEPGMAACHLLRGGAAPDAGANVLTAVSGSSLPAGIQPSGLVFDRALDALCVFGNALVCLQDEWTTVIAPDTGLEIHEVVSQDEGSSMIAIGAGGRWWRRAHNPSGTLMNWMEQASTGVADELVGASIAEDRAVLFGKRAWWSAEGTASLERCSLQSELTAVFLHVGTPFTEIVRASGDVVVYQPETANRSIWSWCRSQQVDFGTGPVLQLANVLCGITSNPRVLTASKLVGTNFCAMD